MALTSIQSGQLGVFPETRSILTYVLNFSTTSWSSSFFLITASYLSARGIDSDKLVTEILQTRMSSAIAAGANGNNRDLTEHPWALHSIFGLLASQDIAVILEWQPASAVPHTVTVGNMVPVARSSTPTCIPLMPSISITGEASETASILYVIFHIFIIPGG